MVNYIRTGSLGLDILLGGGWKTGAIHEIWGEPGSAKTTLAQHAVWELESGQQALWLSLGTEIPHRPSGALLAVPRSAEQAFFIMTTFVLGEGSLVVVDSANGLIRQRELDADPDYTPHPQREYKTELSNLKAACEQGNGTVIFLSKPRDRDRQPVRGTGLSDLRNPKSGSYSPDSSLVKLRIWTKKQDESRMIKAETKNGETLFEVRPGSGIDWPGELVAKALQYDVVTRDGSWIGYGDQAFHGFDRMRDFVIENPEVAVELDEVIRSRASA